MVAYAAIIVVWQILRLVFGDRWWWLGMANSASLYLFLPLLVLGPLALLSLNRTAMLATAVPFLVLVALYGWVVRPKSTLNKPKGAVVLRLLTLNALYTNDDGAAIEELVDAEWPDLICLQELNPRLAADLVARLSEKYRHQVLIPEEGTSGLGIFSRFPLHDVGEIVDPAREVGWKHGAQHVTLDVDGRSVLLLNVHALSSWPTLNKQGRAVFERSFRLRNAQARLWLERVAQHDGPAILIGDFNQTDQSVAYRLLSKKLQDVHLRAGKGLGHTYPAVIARWHGIPVPRRLLRLDYLFVTADWEALDFHIGEWDGQSDHRPVVATLVLSEKQ